MSIVAQLFIFLRRAINRALCIVLRSQFRKCGSNFRFHALDRFSYRTIEVGNNVYIGPGAKLSADVGITIGDGTMFGPNVSIMAGDHNSELDGKCFHEKTAKRPGDDLQVVLEQDVWVGCGAIILKGVTIGRGAIIGAGSVVTNDVPPYCVALGNPALVVKSRGSLDQIRQHEAQAYTTEDRLTHKQLQHLASTL